MKRPSWNDTLMFITVAEHCSFRRAADLLGMKPSTLSHAIKGLEAQLQVRLFQRTTRSVSLTDAGQHLYQRLVPLVRDMDDALESVTAMGQTPGGTLRINGSDAAIRLLMHHVIPDFTRQYPRIALDLTLDNALSDVVKQGFDAGIRLYEDIPQDMVAVRLSGAIRFLTLASPAYLAESAPLTVPQDLLQHRCIRQRLPGGKRYAWEFARDDAAFSLDVPGALTINSSQLMVEAACAGMGIVYVPDMYAREALAQGRLVSVLDAWHVASRGLYLYFPHNRHLSHSMTLFIETVRRAAAFIPPEGA